MYLIFKKSDCVVKVLIALKKQINKAVLPNRLFLIKIKVTYLVTYKAVTYRSKNSAMIELTQVV